MKKYFQKLLISLLTVSLCVAGSIIPASAAENVQNVTKVSSLDDSVSPSSQFIAGVTFQAPKKGVSASKSVTLNRTSTIIGYICMPAEGQSSSKTLTVIVKYANGLSAGSYQLKMDGAYHTISINYSAIPSGTYTVKHYAPPIDLAYISFNFGY